MCVCVTLVYTVLAKWAYWYVCVCVCDSPPSVETDSGVDMSQRHSNLPQEQDSFDDLDEDFPAIGTCKALYNFDGGCCETTSNTQGFSCFSSEA